MKVVFEFDTASEDFDQSELERHNQADKMARCLSHLDDKLRSYYKYDNRGKVDIDEFTQALWNIMEDDGIDLEELGW